MKTLFVSLFIAFMHLYLFLFLNILYYVLFSVYKLSNTDFRFQKCIKSQFHEQAVTVICYF